MKKLWILDLKGLKGFSYKLILYGIIKKLNEMGYSTTLDFINLCDKNVLTIEIYSVGNNYIYYGFIETHILSNIKFAKTQGYIVKRFSAETETEEFFKEIKK